MTMHFEQHDPGSGRYDFGRDDFRATWPVTLLPCLCKESFAKHLTAKWNKLINKFNFVQLPGGHPVSIPVWLFLQGTDSEAL